MTKRKIVLRFIVGTDEQNNYRYKNVTLRNIRPDLNDDQMCEFVARYCSLTVNILEEAVVVDERHLILEEEMELFEEVPEVKKESIIEEEGDVEKGVTTASIDKSEVELVNLKEGIQPDVKIEAPSVRLEGEGNIEKGVTAASFEVDLVNSKKKTIRKGASILTEDQGTFKPKLGEKNIESKNQECSEVKQQSPPRVAESAVLEVSVPKSEICESEIEIWLEDDQDQSVEALIAIIEKELGAKEATPWKTGVGTLPPVVNSKDPGLPVTHVPTDPPFVLPVKKKRMHSPVGKRTKRSKKK